jgi:hypothetical protein
MLGTAVFCMGRLISWIKDTYAYWTSVPYRRYYLGGGPVEDTETEVPAGKVFVEEWTQSNEHKCRVLYEGDKIEPYDGDPWGNVTLPWLWIGDQDREIDLSDTLQRYIVPGNFILYDLLAHYVDHVENITYLDTRSLSFLKFPVEGIRV